MIVKIAALRRFAFALILCAPAMAWGQALADRAPAGTIIYFGWTGAHAQAPGYQGSNLQGVLGESNIPILIDEFIPKVLDRIGAENPQAKEGVEFARSLLGPMWRHPTAIAIAGIDLAGPSGPTPKLMLLTDAGNDAADVKKRIEDLLQKAGPTPFPLKVVEKGGLVAVVVGYAEAEAAIPDAGAKSLANDPEFVKALAQANQNAILTGYVSVDGVVAMVNQAIPLGGPDIEKNWKKSRDMLGLAGIKSAIWTSGFDGKDWATKGFIDAPAPRSGMAGALLDGAPLSEEILAAIPKNSTRAAAFQFDIAGFFTAIRSVVGAFDADSARQFDQVLEQIRQGIGIDVEKDLFANFGSEWAWYTDPAVLGDGLTGMTIVNRLKDPAKAQAALEKLETFINEKAEEQLQKENITIAFRKTRIGNTEVHYLALPLVSPGWAVQDGNLYMGLIPEVVAAAAKQVADKGDSIAMNEAAMALHHRIGEPPASSFEFMDLPRVAPQSYPAWVLFSHLAGAGDLFGVPAPAWILPSAAKLFSHLSAAGEVTWSDAAGYHFAALSPFPGSEALASDPSAMGPATIPLMISIMLPALNKAREQAQQIKSAANLKNIGLGAQIYANNQKNSAFPPDLGTLCVETDLTLDCFVNPSGGHPAPPLSEREEKRKWVNENSDYIWNGAGKTSTTAGPDTPLAWEKPEPGQRGVNILYGDGHVEYVAMPFARQQIEKAQQKNHGL